MSSADSNSEHDHNTQRAVTTAWLAGLVLGFILLFGYTQWGFIGDVPSSEIDWLAVGTANAIGLLAAGGWNSIGLISVGGANSIGVISVGGLNSLGIITISGFNSAGVVSIGGVNSYGIFWGASIYSWNPIIRRGGNVTSSS